MVADVGGFLSFSILSIRSRSLSAALFFGLLPRRDARARTHTHTQTNTYTHQSWKDIYLSASSFFEVNEREKKGRREMRRYLPSAFPIPTRQFYRTDAIVRIDLSNPSIYLFYFQVTILWTTNRMRERERTEHRFQRARAVFSLSPTTFKLNLPH